MFICSVYNISKILKVMEDTSFNRTPVGCPLVIFFLFESQGSIAQILQIKLVWKTKFQINEDSKEQRVQRSNLSIFRPYHVLAFPGSSLPLVLSKQGNCRKWKGYTQEESPYGMSFLYQKLTLAFVWIKIDLFY